MKFLQFLISLTIFLNVNILQVQATETVSYKDYLQQVLDYYPSLKKEYANIEKAVSQKALAASARVPQLWASAKFEYGDDPVYVFGSLLRQNKFSIDDFALGRLNSPSPRSDNSGSIEGQWLLFDFFQTSSRIKSAGLFTESAQYQAELTKMEAILAASEVYSRLALIQDFRKILDEAVGDGNKDVAAAESLNQKGLILGADFYLARMTQSKLMQTRNEILAQQAALSMAFNIIRGKDPTLPVEVSLDFRKPINLEGTAQQWIVKAVDNRLDLKAMGKLLEAQGVEANREKKSFLPKVSAYGLADEHVHRIGSSGGANYVVGVKATMNIFDPGYGARVKLAKAEVSRLLNQYQVSKDQAAKDTAETYYRLEAIKSNVLLAIKVRDDSKQASGLMLPLYREGKRSIDQMISLRVALVESYEHWLRLENSLRQCILSLKFYAGELNQQQAEGIYGQ
ncbi:MAG: TolC family protein [Candidatus Omnitrophota bacterium]